jgi:hypothetical protein
VPAAESAPTCAAPPGTVLATASPTGRMRIVVGPTVAKSTSWVKVTSIGPLSGAGFATTMETTSKPVGELSVRGAPAAPASNGEPPLQPAAQRSGTRASDQVPR